MSEYPRWVDVKVCPICLETREVRIHKLRHQLRIQCPVRLGGCGADVLIPREKLFNDHYGVRSYADAKPARRVVTVPSNYT